MSTLAEKDLSVLEKLVQLRSIFSHSLKNGMSSEEIGILDRFDKLILAELQKEESSDA